MSDKLLTVDEISERLQVCRDTVYRQLRPHGRLHHLRLDLGRKMIRVREQDLNEYLDRSRAS